MAESEWSDGGAASITVVNWLIKTEVNEIFFHILYVTLGYHEYDVPFPAVVVDMKHGRFKSDVCLVETPVGKQILIFSVCFKRK